MYNTIGNSSTFCVIRLISKTLITMTNSLSDTFCLEPNVSHVTYMYLDSVIRQFIYPTTQSMTLLLGVQNGKLLYNLIHLSDILMCKEKQKTRKFLRVKKFLPKI